MPDFIGAGEGIRTLDPDLGKFEFGGRRVGSQFVLMVVESIELAILEFLEFLESIACADLQHENEKLYRTSPRMGRGPCFLKILARCAVRRDWRFNESRSTHTTLKQT
jgi:hypothetical protein